ncbi:MAG: hypothetical protein JWQ81_8529 [Amycolatopsis sp.]|uniref:hypothetical protein n=1 Tax=Amycolatopsis sp. TaxID=37632 RepID=UPI00262A2B01|nr:hypothetical protein [Amycolatopsis sp.]MCU1687790.1 hypothetical protein [Amycolatopsis sp.]
MTFAHPTRKLGKRPPKDAPALRAARFLTGAVPAHPASVDHFSEITDWLMLDNDKYGDCGPAATGHQLMLDSKYLSAAEIVPSIADVLDFYKRSGNPDFDPNDPGGPGDGGVDLQTMLEELVRNGIGGHKALGFAKVDTSNLDEVRAAVAVFGSLLLGVTLETAQQAQTDRGLWDYAKSAVWGGHAVLAGRYTSAKTGDDLAVITWGEIVGTTDAFWAHQVDEAWVVIWDYNVGTAEFQAGVDVAALAGDYFALTGRTFPVPVQPPAPAPVPAPPVTPPAPVGDADSVLAAVLHPWVIERHVGQNHALATAAKTWLAAKGL